MRVRLLVAGALLLACSGPLVAQQNISASSFPGDLGAQINAADAQLGAAAGTIVVDRDAAATTPVQLSQGHGLRIAAVATFSAHITLAGGNDIQCVNGGKIVLSMAKRAALFTGKRISDVSIAHCTVSASNPGPGYMLVAIRGVTNLRVVDNRGDSVPLVNISSVDGTYNAVTPATQSHNVTIDHNTVVMSPPYQGYPPTAVNVQFATQVRITHNQFRGVDHGVEYWGGDGNHDWKSPASPHWLSDMEISDNDCHDVRGSCYWGAMGENVRFLHNRAEHCGDACLDVEDNKDVVLDGNMSTDGGNGAIALLGRCVNIRITNNQLTATTAHYPLFSLFNNAVNAMVSNGVNIQHNTLVCHDSQKPCDIKYENTSDFVFAHNTVTNGMIRAVNLWQQGTTVADNTFTFTVSAAEPFRAINAGAQIKGALSQVLNNVVLSNAPQPPGSVCIYVNSSSPNQPSGRYVVRGNTCGGSNPFPIALDLENTARNGAAVMQVSGNQLHGELLRNDKTGTARFDIHQP